MESQDSPATAPMWSRPDHAPGKRRRMTGRQLFWPAFVPLILLGSLLLNWGMLIPAAFAAPLAGTSAQGHNTYQQFLKEGQPSTFNQGTFQRPSMPAGALKPQTGSKAATMTTGTAKHLPSVEPATMQDQTYTLDDSFVLHRPATRTARNLAPNQVQGTAIPAGSTPLVSKGTDGRLEVQVPRGSLDFAHATLADGSAPIGQLLLRIHQISGHFIEAESILGTYQVQVVDSQGDLVQGVQLVHPITLIYHYQSWEMTDLDLNPSQVHLSWPTQSTTQPISGTKAQTSATQPSSTVVPMHNDPKAQTLTAQTSTITAPLTASGTPEIATPGKPDLFETSGNSGQYSYSYPLAVAPGPDGFTPQLQLSYSSQSTNERHSRRAPAGAEGEGFSLSLGSITVAQYPSSSTGGAATWYSLNGVDGVSDRLVPIAGEAGLYDTQHISHLRVQFVNNCWDVWGLDGSFEQLGCTPDSTQKTSSGTYEWDVNEILAPYNSQSQVKTMIISYLQDSPDGGTTIRDAGIKQIQYGFASSANATSLSLVAGTVDFHYHMPNVPSGQSAFATAYGTNYNCTGTPPGSTTLRCDDPGQFGTIAPPSVMSTMNLDSVTSYVGADTANQPAYSYSFTYQDRAYDTNYWDPYTYTQEATSGEHVLTQITPTVYLQGAAHTREGMVFSYTSWMQDSYNDPSVPALLSGHVFSGQTFWSYLTQYEDMNTGEGAQISYAEAFGNPHGTPFITDSQGHVLDDRFDPLYCTNNANNSDTSKQCTGNYGLPFDFSWGVQVVTQIAALGTDSSGNQTVATTTYHYALAAVPSSNAPVSNCNPISGSGVPAQEADCVADNWSPGYNGTPNQQKDGDWLDYYHAEYRGFNVVYTTSWAGNLTADYYFSTQGWWFPQSDGLNYNAGQLYQEDVYQGNVATPGALLRETLNTYAGVGNVPAGNPYTGIDTCQGLDNPVYNPCVVAPLETKTIFFEGHGGASNAPWVDTKYTYDDINPATSDPPNAYVANGYHNMTQEVISSSNASTITKKWTYTVTNQTVNGWVYYTVDRVAHSEIDDANGHVWQCQDTAYDEGAPSGVPTPDAGLVTTTTSYSACGNASTALKNYTAYDQYGNTVATVDSLAVANPGLYSGKGCTLSTAPVALSASWTIGRYTSCTAYDTTHTAGLPTSAQNALGQSTSTSYDYTSGAQPTGITDANGQTAGFSYSYDQWGNETINLKQPGETGSYTTRQVEGTQCASKGDALPCYQIASNSSLYSGVMSRTYYDALGRAVETRTPGSTPGDDTVVMTVYNDQNNSVFKSVPFQVADGSSWIDPNGAKDINGVAPAGTITFSDALGRTIATQDPNFGSAQEPGLACSWTLSGKYTSCINYDFSDPFDATLYSLARHIDANGHQTMAWTDALGNEVGTGAYANVYPDDSVAEKITRISYNALGKPTSVGVVDEHFPTGGSVSITTTMTYDDMGRLLTLTDPDQGTFSYSYDADSHVIATTQTVGSNSRTVGVNYDLLGRVGCEQTAGPTINATGACSAGNILVQNIYDIPEDGWVSGTNDFPVGRLSRSNTYTYYPDGTSALVGEDTRYDQRGRVVENAMGLQLPNSWNITMALTTDDMTQGYNDANQPTTTSTQDGSEGYTFTNVYDPTNGALQGLSNNSTATANLATLTYNEYAQLSGLTLLNGASSSPTSLASEQFSYDANLRPTSLTANWLPPSGNSGQILAQSRAYDNTSNVTSANTTFTAVPGQSGSGGADVQNFCYDEQNRLVWSGNGGTQPSAGTGTCGSGTLASGLSGAGYTAPFSYTNLGQIWQGPVNGQGTAQQYLYCNSQPHQLSGIYPTGTTCSNKGSATASYSASYDPYGNETTRVYNGTTATLSYDTLNHLVAWSAGSSNEWNVYDASGNRVLLRSISGGVTRLKVYAFGLQELDFGYNGYVAGQIDYYSLAGHLIGSTDGISTTYDLTDAQGSVLASLSTSAMQGEQIYGPYGNQRYTEGTIGTDKGYTGQFHDALTGLDYYNARFYDPVAGVFLSPDSVQGNPQGMDPYAYVADNPETNVDPTGQRYVDDNGDSAWISNGSIYEQQLGSRPKPIGHTKIIVYQAHEKSSKSVEQEVNVRLVKGAHVICSSACQKKAQAKATDTRIQFGHEADSVGSVISDLGGGSIWGFAAAIAAFLSKFVPGVPEWLVAGGGAGLIGLGITALTFLAKGIADQLTILQTTLKTLASDFGLEGQGSGGWTIAGLENFKETEHDYISDQYLSTEWAQAEVSASGTGGFPPLAQLINGGIHTMFEAAYTNVVNVINEQEGYFDKAG